MSTFDQWYEHLKKLRRECLASAKWSGDQPAIQEANQHDADDYHALARWLVRNREHLPEPLPERFGTVNARPPREGRKQKWIPKASRGNPVSIADLKAASRAARRNRDPHHDTHDDLSDRMSTYVEGDQ